MPPSDEPLRVLHLTAGSDAGGVSRYLFEMCQAMRREGHQVAIAGERGAWHRLFEGADWTWLELPLKGNPLALWRSARVLEKFARENSVQLIHAHYRRTTLISRYLKPRLRLPVLFTLHVTGISLKGLNRVLSDFGDHTHVASADAKQWLIDVARLSERRITVIPHGIDPDKFPLSDAADQAAARRELGFEPDATVAGFVNRFDYPKNEDWMVDVALAARPRVPDLRIVMIGEGPNEPALRERIRANGLGGVFRILPYGDPKPVYRASDAILISSEAEGFSLVNTEAMSTGRPVLRTRTAGTSEQIVEGVTGRSVAIDRDAFVKASVEFLADRAALRRMGAAAAEHVRRNLTFDLQYRRTLDLYRRMIATGGSPD